MVEPILTILVPTYNQEDSIAKALDSILEQKTTYPYVIWIAEDCSTDNTLAVCKSYEENYPGKIKLFAAEKNTKARQVHDFMLKVNTKYYAIVEGDDYWCDQNKIQIALNFLENYENKKYIGYGTDCFYNDLINSGNTTTFTKMQGYDPYKINKDITIETYIFIHASALIVRNVFEKMQKVFAVRDKEPLNDLKFQMLWMDIGPIYLAPEVTSVYNYHGKGMHSGQDYYKQDLLRQIIYRDTNRYLDYRYDHRFSRFVRKRETLKFFKTLFGKKNGWDAYIIYCKIYYNVCSKFIRLVKW